jgi:tagatose 6-phosphate kinase
MSGRACRRRRRRAPGTARGNAHATPTMIVCLGTTPTMQRTMLFDRLTPDGVNRATEVREYASGKSVNVAKVLRTLGHEALATGPVGGTRGEQLRQHLAREGVRADFVTVSAQTRLCTTVIDRATGQVTELVEEAARIEPADWQALARKLEALLPTARAWVFSGSLPLGAPPDFYTHWLAKFRRHNPHVVIDARGGPLKQALRQPGVVAKCNREEFEGTIGATFPDEEQLRGAMHYAVPQGGSLVVTLGRDGAIAHEGGRFWRVRVPPVRVVSAVGSGDAFAAGLAAGRERHPDDPRRALALAAACGAANAMTTDSGWVRPSDLGEILPRVVVEEVTG